MSFGKMNTFIEIIKPINVKDKEGFVLKEDEVIANTRAYFEPKHGSEKWVARINIFEATALFRFRKVPKISIDTDMIIICNQKRFEIKSVEDIKGKGMYIEVLGKVME